MSRTRWISQLTLSCLFLYWSLGDSYPWWIDVEGTSNGNSIIIASGARRFQRTVHSKPWERHVMNEMDFMADSFLFVSLLVYRRLLSMLE